MRNVKRSTKPQTLLNKSRRWTADLLVELAKRNVKTSEALFCKYNQADVKYQLNLMYKNKCCYCESRVNVVSYEHIEHRKPKSKFPELTYEWGNLHIACQKCNMNKGEKYNTKAPILDSVVDTPISDHLSFQLATKGLRQVAKTTRGRTTIDDADLNRDELLDARRSVFNNAYNLITDIKDDPHNPALPEVLDKLDDLTNESYGSIVQYLKQREL